MPKVFVSYAREDKAFVDEHIRPILTTLGLEVWIDTQGLHGAERWQEAIQRALSECEYFIVVASQAAAASPAVRGEVEWILKNRPNRLIPIRSSQVRFDGIHASLSQIQYIDCIGKPCGHTAALIARAMFHLADRRATDLAGERNRLQDIQTKTAQLNGQLCRENKALNQQLDQVINFDGDWCRPIGPNVPTFVPRSERNAPIIAVMNVKGGVGKSTIAVNLAGTWWGQITPPKRVLLIDLDFQRSGTALCLAPKDLQDLTDADLLVNSLFDERILAEQHFKRSIRRVGRGEGYLLAANDKLTRVETQMMARWLTNQTSKDLRFLLRDLLHGPAVQDKFDLVIIDCPPRVHTASINALAAADYLLIPVLLDLTSADSAPRMLKWVQVYRQAGVCPNLEILGIVANKKSDRRSELLAREENIWAELPGKCSDAWRGEVPFCKTLIPNNAAVAECTHTPGRLACEDPRISPVFLSLANELGDKITSIRRITS